MSDLTRLNDQLQREILSRSQESSSLEQKLRSVDSLLREKDYELQQLRSVNRVQSEDIKQMKQDKIELNSSKRVFDQVKSMT